MNFFNTFYTFFVLSMPYYLPLTSFEMISNSSSFFARIALQQESEKYTHQRIQIANLRISLNEALTQNTKFQEQLCLIKNIVNLDYDHSPEEKNVHTLPSIEVISFTL